MLFIRAWRYLCIKLRHFFTCVVMFLHFHFDLFLVTDFFISSRVCLLRVTVNRLATSITQLTLCQVTTDEIDAATILDSCTISASCEVSQAPKALLLMPRTAKGASTSSNELNAQVSLPTDDEYHAFQDQDQSTRALPKDDDDQKRTTERSLRVP